MNDRPSPPALRRKIRWSNWALLALLAALAALMYVGVMVKIKTYGF